VYEIHSSPEFRKVYDTLWRELKPEVNMAQA
jgi:hypothetical protein